MSLVVCHPKDTAKILQFPWDLQTGNLAIPVCRVVPSGTEPQDLTWFPHNAPHPTVLKRPKSLLNPTHSAYFF